ncbi:MAG: glycosyl hydrolase [Acidobacteriota bacterium]
MTASLVRRTHVLAALPVALAVSAAPASAQRLSEAALAQLEWRAIGPAVQGGRIDDVAVDERNPSTIYIGAASGGVWKTTNAGTTWTPIFDRQGTASIGDIALAAANPDLVWVGTGEPNNRQSSSFGDGVYKSIDGGRTWAHMGLAETQHIGRVIVDPADPDTVYVAALGRLWGASTERGVYKTTDGGRTWTQALFVDEHTGAVDLAMDPHNRHVLYAATYQRRRAPWGFNGGGPGSGLHKSVDGGRTWTKLTNGLPGGTVGRIGLAVWRRDPRVVYATVEHRTEGGTYRSDDGGATWRKMSDVNPRPMYYSKIHIDPTSDRRIYVLGASMFVSDDGGRTFADPVSGREGPNQAMSPTYDVGVHGDHHALWINPANPKHLILGNDGGLYYSFDGSITWDKVNNLPLGQFYGIGVDMATPYNIYGGLQDTHSFGGPSATRHYLGILNEDWVQINTGDGMYAQVDPTDPATVYTESQDGNLSRFHRPTGDRKSIRPTPPPGEAPYRFNWTSPIVISPHDSTTVYFGGNRVFRSTDRGETWSAGPDITRNEDRATFEIMGQKPGPEVLSRNDGVSAWGTITALAESPVQAGVLWAGTDDGLVQLSRDGGTTWTNVTDRLPGPARKGRISRVEPGYRDAGTVYVALDRHQDDDFAPYLFVSHDFGHTWATLSDGLPKTGWINVVRVHPRNPAMLVVGTETGLFVSLDAGAAWTRFTHGFPTVPVDDLVIHPRDNDLVVGTHGRSIYVLDDITPLSGFTAQVAASDLHLFPPRAATVLQRWKHESYSAQRVFAGPNPPFGAILTYYLRAAGKGPATVTIRDASNRVVRIIEGAAAAGLNRVVWDLRSAAPANLANARGPFVVPGSYTATVQVDGREARAPVSVTPDPLFPMSDADRQARFDFLTETLALQAELARHADALRAVREQLRALDAQLKQLPSPPAAVVDRAAALDKAIAALQARVGGGGGGGGEEGGGFGGGGLRARLTPLVSEIDGSGIHQGTLSGPTAGQLQRLQAARADASVLAADLTRTLDTDLAALNDEIVLLKVPRIVRPR